MFCQYTLLSQWIAGEILQVRFFYKRKLVKEVVCV